jgi:hypothetical protein
VAAISQVDNFYIDGEGEEDLDLSAYIPSGVTYPESDKSLHSDCQPPDGGPNMYDGTLVEDVQDCDEDGNPIVTDSIFTSVTVPGVIETLHFSDDEISEEEGVERFINVDAEYEHLGAQYTPDAVRPTTDTAGDVLAALAEFRRIGGARYAAISDAQLIAEMTSADAKTGSTTDATTMPYAGIEIAEEKQRWYEDVEPFAVVDSNEELS